jgi:hypothetical protein
MIPRSRVRVDASRHGLDESPRGHWDNGALAQCRAYPAGVAEGLRIVDLVQDERLGISVAAGGSHLDRVVRWAHSTELLDPRAYLRGGELVLTVGSGLTGPERCIAFVNALLECGVAGLGLGIGDVHSEAPPALVIACRDAELPLLVVPPTTPFMDITELLAEHRIRIATDRSQHIAVGRLLDAVSRHQALPDLLADDLEQSGLDVMALVVSAWPSDAADLVEVAMADVPCLIGYAEAAVVVITGEADFAARAAETLGVAAGIALPLALADLQAGLSAAMEALAIASRGEPEQSGSRSHFASLVNSLPQSSLMPFLQDIIEPLDEYDEATGAQLVDSLSQFLAHDGSVQAAARTMHLHPNSLRHRLARVHELTGRNPLLFRDQVDLAIALRARARRGGLRES